MNSFDRHAFDTNGLHMPEICAECERVDALEKVANEAIMVICGYVHPSVTGEPDHWRIPLFVLPLMEAIFAVNRFNDGGDGK